MTYYKYQERDLESAVDWGVVGASLEKDITDIADKRAKRKKDVEDNVIAIAQKIGEAPLGEHKSANQYSLEAYQQFGSSAHGMLKLLQKGKIDHNQFNRMMGNLNESAELFGTVMTEYHDEWKAHLDAQQSGEEGAYGAFVVGEVEAYMNFSETAVQVGPDGRAVIAKYTTDENGNRVLSDQFMSVNALRDRIKNRNRVFDVEGNLSKQASVLAKTYEESVNTGIIRSMDDVRQSSGYDNAKKNYINSHLSNEFNIQSILTDFMMGDDAGEYYLTTDESKKSDPYAIFMEYDKQSGQPIPKPTKEQKEKASQALSDVFDTMVSRSLKLKQEFAPQRPSVAERQYNAGLGAKVKQEDSMANNVAKLWYGDEGELKEALQFFGGNNENITDIERTPNGITVTMKNGDTEQLSFLDSDGNPMSLEQFIKGATILTGETDVSAALERNMKDGSYSPGMGREFSQLSSKETMRTTVDPYKDAAAFVKQSIPNTKTFFSGNEEEGAQKIQSIVGKLGLKAEEGGGIYEAVDIVDSEGNTIVQIDFNVKDENEAEVQMQKLLNLFENTPEDELKEIMKAAKSTSTGKKKLPGT